MTFAVILVVTAAATLALRNPIKKWPMLFYALAVIVDVLFVVGSFVALPRTLWSGLFLLVQKCTLSLALFVVVMYIGVFARDSKVKRWLRPIRAELSIIAWILSLGHMAVYLASYLPRMAAGGPMHDNVTVAFVLAIVLFVLLLVLGATSFNMVKKRMKTESWKRLQRLSYVFFALVYAHLLLMLLPSALHGAAAPQANVAVYSVVFVGYFVLRLVRFALDRRAEGAEVAPAGSDGDGEGAEAELTLRAL